MGVTDQGASHRPFEPVWADLAPRLERALSARGVSASSRPDVIQETAIRLFSRWDRINTDQDVFPLACTIARNLSHDYARREARTVPLEDGYHLNAVHDTEDAAIARIELAKVLRGLTQLIPRYRSILLGEVGVAVQIEKTTSGALKVARSRARVRLQQNVQRMRGLAVSAAFRCRDLYRRASQQPELSSALGAVGPMILVSVILLLASPSGSGASSHESSNPRSPIHHLAQRAAETSGRSRLYPAVIKSDDRHIGGSGRKARDRRGHDPALSSLAHLPPGGSEGEDKGHIGSDGYHFRQRGEAHAGDDKVSWRYEHKYKTPPCVRETLEGNPSTDCRGKKPSGYVEIEHEGRKYRAEY